MIQKTLNSVLSLRSFYPGRQQQGSSTHSIQWLHHQSLNLGQRKQQEKFLEPDPYIGPSNQTYVLTSVKSRCQVHLSHLFCPVNLWDYPIKKTSRTMSSSATSVPKRKLRINILFCYNHYPFQNVHGLKPPWYLSPDSQI